MAIATGLISSLCNVASSGEMPFNRSSFNMVLPLFSSVLNSFLHFCVGDNLQYAYHGFSARLGKCRASKGTSYTIGRLPKLFKVAGNEA